jgi:hypothetical protein
MSPKVPHQRRRDEGAAACLHARRFQRRNRWASYERSWMSAMRGGVSPRPKQRGARREPGRRLAKALWFDGSGWCGRPRGAARLRRTTSVAAATAAHQEVALSTPVDGVTTSPSLRGPRLATRHRSGAGPEWIKHRFSSHRGSIGSAIAGGSAECRYRVSSQRSRSSLSRCCTAFANSASCRGSSPRCRHRPHRGSPRR